MVPIDIIDVLTEDHDKLRHELVGIKRALSQDDLRRRIKIFISKYELHESIEEEILFPVLALLPEEIRKHRLMPNYDKIHERIWVLLDQLVELLSHAHFPELQQSFFKVDASVEAHLEHEERVLFPTIREVVEKKVLEDLGGQAARRFSRFAGI